MDMEIGDLMHLGVDIVVQMLMLYATSPLARDAYEKLMTGDPFNIDVKLDDTSSNRSAEIVETYLKTIGKRIVFRKVPKKKINPVTIDPIVYDDPGRIEPITFLDKRIAQSTFDYLDKEKAEKGESIYPILFNPISYDKSYDEVMKFIKENEHTRLKDLAEAIANGAVDFEK